MEKYDKDTLARLADDPSLLSELSTRIIRKIGVRNILGILPMCSKVICDYYREEDNYPVDICSSSLCGLKLLAEKQINYNPEKVRLSGWVWLYET